jgi:hypothetical protein
MATKANDHTAFVPATKRPDRADEMTEAHATAVYTNWLKAEVRKAIDETRGRFRDQLLRAQVVSRQGGFAGQCKHRQRKRLS